MEEGRWERRWERSGRRGRGLRGKRRKSQWEKGRWNRRKESGAMERDLLGESAAAAEGWKGAWPLLSLATGGASRARGLLCAGPSEDALLLAPCRDIHTVGMRRPIDVAFVDKTGRVVEAHRAVGL